MRVVFSAVLAGALAASGLAVAGVAVSGVAMAQTVTRAAYAVEPFAPSAQITIQGTGVRLRAEPFASKDTPVLSSGSTGLPLTVVGIARQSDWNWYQVILRSGQKAFIRSDYTSAPSRGGGMADYAGQPYGPTQPSVAQPVQVTPLPVQPVQPVQPYQPALPPIPTQPSQSGGVISLTPGSSGQIDLPPASANPAPAPADTGLLSISPSAPQPRFSDAPSGVSPMVGQGGYAQQIRAQINLKRCWTDSSSMMDAQRLKASFMVGFASNGRFAAEPRMIVPDAEPSDDPALMVFVAKARAAMRTCNALGFDVPAGYYSDGGGELRLDFSAR